MVVVDHKRVETRVEVAAAAEAATEVAEGVVPEGVDDP